MGQGCKAVKSNTDVLFKINLGWLCSLCTPICWENRQADSWRYRLFRLSPVFVILKRLASFFITCAILRYTECRKHSLYRFRGTSMPSRLPPLPEAVYMGFGADDRGRTGTGISSHGILSPGRLPVPPHRHTCQQHMKLYHTF